MLQSQGKKGKTNIPTDEIRHKFLIQLSHLIDK